MEVWPSNFGIGSKEQDEERTEKRRCTQLWNCDPKNALDDPLEEASKFPWEGTLLIANLSQRTDLWGLSKWSGPLTRAFAFA